MALVDITISLEIYQLIDQHLQPCIKSLRGPFKNVYSFKWHQILQPRRPLHSYLSQVNLSHGVNLHCYIKILGGDGGDEVGETFKINYVMYMCAVAK